jgi:hypothetical protein
VWNHHTERAAEVVVVRRSSPAHRSGLAVEIGNSFFFVSMLITGNPAFRYFFLRRAIFSNCALIAMMAPWSSSSVPCGGSHAAEAAGHYVAAHRYLGRHPLGDLARDNWST